MQTYTSTNNPVATYGESSASTLALQQSLNTQNAGQAGWTPLEEDGMYGPLTQAGAAFQPQNQLVADSGAANSEFATYSSSLTNALGTINPPASTTTQPAVTIENVSQTDPYAQMLDSLSATSNASTKALISSIQASTMNQENTVNAQYDSYKRGLQLLGIQHNEAESTPDLLMGHIQQAQNEQMKKIGDLEMEEKKALMDAEYAQQQNDLETLKAKMDRVDEIKAEKNQALKDIADQLSYENSIAEDEAHLIYDTLDTLNDADKETFIQEVAKQYNIPLATLTTALADEKLARDAAAAEAAKKAAGATPKPLAVGTIQSLPMSEELATSLEALGVLSEDIINLQKGLEAGYSIDEIIAEYNLSEEIAKVLRSHVVTSKAASETSSELI